MVMKKTINIVLNKNEYDEYVEMLNKKKILSRLARDYLKIFKVM